MIFVSPPSMVGLTDASMTSGGNVDSIWLKRAVQENVRPSISAFASRAAATTTFSSSWLMPCRDWRALRAELVGRPPVVAHGRGQDRILSRQAHDLDELSGRQREDDERQQAEPEVHGALVVERTSGQVGSQHYAPSA